MARRTFFSFRYKKDNWRASIVRNCWVTQDAAGFFDHAEWEVVKKKSDEKIKEWIDDQLKGSSVTVVLIGEDTYGKKWINYEIDQSWNTGKGLLGIYVHNLKDRNGFTSTKGKNPFDQWIFKIGNQEVAIDVYDWVYNEGYKNLGKWIEKAAAQVGR